MGDLLAAHVPAVARGSTAGVWKVFCLACSRQLGRHIYPCCRDDAERSSEADTWPSTDILIEQESSDLGGHPSTGQEYVLRIIESRSQQDPTRITCSNHDDALRKAKVFRNVAGQHVSAIHLDTYSDGRRTSTELL